MKNFLVLLLFGIISVSSVLAEDGYTGEDHDSQSGVYYLRNRNYDPETGTYLTKDPMGVGGGLNTYLYCQNDPINNTDPLGLWTWGGVFDSVINGGTGVADALTFGLVKLARDHISFYDGTVDYSSGSYIGGQVVGTVATFAVGAGEIAVGAKGLQVAARQRQ